MTSETGIETEEEFVDGLSPQVIHMNEYREEAVCEAVSNYARQQGADGLGIAFGCAQARYALSEGHTAHRAIRAGEAAIDRYMLENDGIGC